MTSEKNSFYITTPIFYVNDAPHIGHAYTEVAADVLARWHRARGEDSFLLLGTDEHGEKILRTATANNSTAQEWTDRLVHDAWLPLLETIDIDNQDFIRTTEDRHKSNVQRFIQKLYDDGFIYQGAFKGAYCVGCEEYKNKSDLVAGTGDYQGQEVCAIHSKPVEELEENNYFFRLSQFQQPLLDHYKQNPDFISPESARNEVVSFVSRGLDDLSISRSKEKFDWGIDIPWDNSHITYVWFDALLNYVTAIGYGEDEAKKKALAEIYRANWDIYASLPRGGNTGADLGDQMTRVRDSATFLSENFEKAPMLMIPCIKGRLENVDVATGAGGWGSLLPAVWSFMLALRERGIGSAWTTIHLMLDGEKKAAELLGIPYEKITQGGMFPIAYTKGTDFKPAKREPLEKVLHWDKW